MSNAEQKHEKCAKYDKSSGSNVARSPLGLLDLKSPWATDGLCPTRATVVTYISSKGPSCFILRHTANVLEIRKISMRLDPIHYSQFSHQSP